ncbi:L-proline trans-4-hydroxylase-like [Amphiura filiformis]|uniref:L-proline trans-4-hydroxylase-like n=1 Tax=Amphiura filiformis TaxID=82378 RepID=UPI003B21900A
MAKVKMATDSKDWISERSFAIDDGTGRNLNVCVWDQPGDDVLGMIARCPKVVQTMSELLNGEVYHYHSKLIMKDPHTGAAHVWHQDYGYWYQGGCLFPDMGSVSIALDKAYPENGCLQLLRGSHRAGRVDHIKIGDQFGADPKRVKYYQEKMEHINVEMEPGDAVFFHSNVLHTAPQNNSDSKRWVFIVGYNRADNSPAFNSPHPTYNPINMVDNSAIKECQKLVDFEGKKFYLPSY